MIGAANNVKLLFIDEVTPGTTPATPALQDLRFNNETLTYNNTTVESEEIRNDRNVADMILVGRDVSGQVNCEFSGLTYDKILRNGLMADADWTTLNMTGITFAAVADGFTDSANGFVSAGVQAGQMIQVDGFAPSSINKFYRVLTVAAGAITTDPAPPTTDSAGDSVTIKGSTIKSGKTDRAMTIQKRFTDLSPVVYQNFRGCRVGALRFGMTNEAKITFGFDVIGMTAENTGTQITGASDVAKTTTGIMNATTNAYELTAKNGSGLSTALYFTEVSLNFDNGLRALKALGVFGSLDVRAGTINAVATINPYFENKEVLDAFNNNASFTLSWRVTSTDGYTYIFTMPNCKFQSQQLTAGGRDTDMIVQGQCKGLGDATLGYTLRVDKFGP